MEVARQKSVGRAAEVLNVTQPAVSRTLRELEDIAGVALTERHGRGIRLSPYGEVFLQHAGASLTALRSGVNALKSAHHAGASRVRIGALPTVSATLIPDAVSRFIASGLNARLSVVSGDNRVLLDQLRDNELDLVVGRLAAPESMGGLTFEPLYRDRIVFIVAADHPLAERRQFPVEALLEYPVLSPIRGSIIKPVVDRLFVEQGIAEPRVAIETVSDAFGRAFVARHRAIWIISRGVVAADIHSGMFRELPVDTASTLGAVGLTLRSSENPDGALAIFVNFLRECADSISRGAMALQT